MSDCVCMCHPVMCVHKVNQPKVATILNLGSFLHVGADAPTCNNQ